MWLRNLITQMDRLKESKGQMMVSSHPSLKWAEPDAPWVVDDCRFTNEYYGLRARGFVTVRVEADQQARVDRLKANGKFTSDAYLDHEIEHYLDDEPVDYTITNDGSTDDLYDELVEVLRRERKRR